MGATTTEHDKIMLQTYAMAKARDEAERAMVQEYARSNDPAKLLHQRIYEIIACTANSAIDIQPAQAAPRDNTFEWHRENSSRTEKRIGSDLLFSRLVSAQAHLICEEVDLYRRAMVERQEEARGR